MNNKYLKFFTQFYKSHRRLPSYREFMTLAGLKSTNAVHKIVGKLIEEGFLRKENDKRLALGMNFFTIPILGDVSAGFPTPAEEELCDVMSVDDYLINNKEATYMLKVSGDSMIDAGIMPDDLVLVERGRTPQNRDIVIAEIDNGWTMKYFEKNGGQVKLIAANAKYPPFTPKVELKIIAVVVGVIRKYKS